MQKRFWLPCIAAYFFSIPFYAIVPNLDMVDTPTAVTLPRATYDVSFWAYNDGGILSKAAIGLHDNIYLGVSFDVEKAIGNKPARMNIPGVVAKVKFTDGWQQFPILIAMGYDSFYTGSEGKQQSDNPFDRVIYGPYAVITKPLFMLGLEQHFHVGVRVPMQPVYEPRNTAMFFAFDFPIGIFVPMVEVERIFFDASRLDKTLVNIGFRFNLFENLALELNFMLAKNATANRMLVIEYMSAF
ncbi:MAG: hypothetical protein D6767_10080 [Candidatus Hydrogenedentota bacterium]|nr:MAG: hypothetical protein D6767_10080 [Candidatus Hydrogenedentota bacterium]